MFWSVYTVIGLFIVATTFKNLVQAGKTATDKYKEDGSYALLVVFISVVLTIFICLLVIAWPFFVSVMVLAKIIEKERKGKSNAKI